MGHTHNYSPATINPLRDEQIPSMNVSTLAGFSTTSIAGCHIICLLVQKRGHRVLQN
jgi:hypothetical protein